jgi:CRP-like cAMP-binding protein
MRLATPITVPAGRQLCREGAPGSEFFVIESGQIWITQHGRTVNALGRGQGLGEVALLNGGRRIATATAIEPTELYVFNRAEFATLLCQAPSVHGELLHQLASRVH